MRDLWQIKTAAHGVTVWENLAELTDPRSHSQRHLLLCQTPSTMALDEIVGLTGEPVPNHKRDKAARYASARAAMRRALIYISNSQCRSTANVGLYLARIAYEEGNNVGVPLERFKKLISSTPPLPHTSDMRAIGMEDPQIGRYFKEHYHLPGEPTIEDVKKALDCREPATGLPYMIIRRIGETDFLVPTGFPAAVQNKLGYQGIMRLVAAAKA